MTSVFLRSRLGYAARNGEIISDYKILLRKPELESHLEDHM